MRQILFKAKRIDNGEWVEGLYFKVPKDEFGARIICENVILPDYLKPYDYYRYYIIQNNTEDNSKLYGTIASDSHEIDLETLCQYTGIKDKNDNKIWENDIISIDTYDYTEPSECFFGKVVYCNAWACWCIKQSGEEKPIPLCECEGSYLTKREIEGNTFDNPELLEEL